MLRHGPSAHRGHCEAVLRSLHSNNKNLDHLSVKIIKPTDGNGLDFSGHFAVVHHPIAPCALAAPWHRHKNEDEYSYVLKGTLGALLGDDVVSAGRAPGWSNRNGQWHTFWNAGETPCEIIEVISPSGFENYFREVAAA